MRKRFYLLLSLLVIMLADITLMAQSPERYTISGFIYEKGSRETLVGVNIYPEGTSIGVASNTFGFYSLTLPSGKYELVFSSIGYQPRVFDIDLNEDIELSVELDHSLELEEVIVTGEMSRTSSRSAHMSVVEIPVRQIKSIPAFLGEKDALKVIQLMPGVQSGSEGNSGLYVRGGTADQNLIILDDATVYNAYHLFGFFSVFNGDALKSVELTKGGFPARYGGRLSSVLDITMKDGNKEEFSGEAGIGLISSRLMLEGPIVKDKASFVLTGRRTYIDALIYPFLPSDFKAGYFFHDYTAKLNWEINSKNRIYLSGYFGKDKFYARERYDWGEKFEAGLYWQNSTSTLRWNRIMTSRLFSNLSLIVSDYTMSIFALEGDKNTKFELSYKSGIRDYGVKYDFTWQPDPAHTVRFGVHSIFHTFTPSAIVLKDDYFDEFISSGKQIHTVESAVYIEDEVKIWDYGIINAGVRLSHFQHKDFSSIRPEPRISGSYFLNNVTSVKASYAMMNQYIHLLSNTGIGLPTDLWVPATNKVPSQDTWQTALGLVRDVPRYNLTLSLEGYYKEAKDIIAYKEGASFLQIDAPELGFEMSWEDNVTNGQGWSYGIEFLAHKKAGQLSGWVGYTLSWADVQFDEINKGETFPANHDRRHDISVVGIYELSERVTLSATWVYGTGAPTTLPLATYPYTEHSPQENGGGWFYTAEDYGGRNAYRMAPYHRLDFGVQFHKKKRWYTRTWEIGVYNAYNRRNPFFYYIDDVYRYKDGEEWKQKKLRQVSIFPLIPSATWSIKF